MKRTNVFATIEERDSLRRMVETPAITLQCGSPQSPLDRSHELALQHGLPEIMGRYGIDLETREFIAP